MVIQGEVIRYSQTEARTGDWAIAVRATCGLIRSGMPMPLAAGIDLLKGGSERAVTVAHCQNRMAVIYPAEMISKW